MGQYVKPEDSKQYDYFEYLADNHQTAGKWRSTGLVYELPNSNDKFAPLFTLKDTDYINDYDQYLFSLKRLFLEIGDPTEYQFAIQVFNSWKAWEKMKAGAVIRAHLRDWLEELDVRQQSQAIRNIAGLTHSDKEATAFQASKYIAEKGWANPGKMGRKSNRTKAKEQRVQEKVQDEIGDDLERILNPDKALVQ